MNRTAGIVAGACIALVAGCGVSPGPATLLDAYLPSENAEYLGIGPAPLGEDIVLIQVSMRGAEDREDVLRYADCGVAGYGVLEGLGYARHIRTTTDKTGGFWTGDAVYTLSPERPRGARVIETRAFAEACEQKGIPTV